MGKGERRDPNKGGSDMVGQKKALRQKKKRFKGAGRLGATSDRKSRQTAGASLEGAGLRASREARGSAGFGQGDRFGGG